MISTLKPETALIRLSNPAEDPERTLRAAALQDEDLQALLALAEQHQMLGIIAPPLLEMPDPPLKPPAQAQWSGRWRALAMRDLAHLAALRQILPAASREGIQPVLLKGFSVHLQAYPRNAARGSCDIDLLLPPAEIPAMGRCLETLGFSLRGKHPWGRPIALNPPLPRWTHEAPFFRETDGLQVELHWSLCAPVEERSAGLRLPELMRGRRRTLHLGDTACAIPGREEELLFLCLHLLNGSPFILRGVSDLLRLLAASPAVEWDRLTSLAGASGTGATAYYALDLVEQAAPGTVPAAALSALRRRSGPRWLLSPTLRLTRLVHSRGGRLSDLGTRWKGALFAGRPWVWIPYQLALQGKSALRRIGLC